MNPYLTWALIAAVLWSTACRTSGAKTSPAPSTGETPRAFVTTLLREREHRECLNDECMRAAFAGCVAAHLERKEVTLEGDPLIFDYFIALDTNGCRVDVVRDHSSDRWGECQVDRIKCATLDAALADDPIARGCAQGEVLFRAPRCPTPRGQQQPMRGLCPEQ